MFHLGRQNYNRKYTHRQSGSYLSFLESEKNILFSFLFIVYTVFAEHLLGKHSVWAYLALGLFFEIEALVEIVIGIWQVSEMGVSQAISPGSYILNQVAQGTNRFRI